MKKTKELDSKYKRKEGKIMAIINDYKCLGNEKDSLVTIYYQRKEEEIIWI